MSVSVYILNDNPLVPSTSAEQETASVREIFSDELFLVNVVSHEIPEDLLVENENMTHEQIIEEYLVMKCLDHAFNSVPDQHVLIVKSSSTTNLDSTMIADRINIAISLSDWDLFYLCKWMDKCHLYTDPKMIVGKNTRYVKSMAPQGIQALLFSPEGRDVVLGKKENRNGKKFISGKKSLSLALSESILNRDLIARVCVPNLIDYNVLLATRNEDYLKTQDCEEPPKISAQIRIERVPSWIYLSGSILLILLVVIFFVRGRKKKRNDW